MNKAISEYKKIREDYNKTVNTYESVLKAAREAYHFGYWEVTAFQCALVVGAFTEDRL